MIFFIDAMTPADYQAWLAHHRRPPPKPAAVSDPAAAAGLADFEHQSCAGCHTIAGTTAHGTVGPDLTYLGSRRTIGAGTINNTPANLAAWIRDSQLIKPGNAMPPSEISARQINQIVAYLESQR
jgi:cytochrome c oxidase subunit II